LTKGTGTLLLGNGDIQTLKEAHKKIKTYGLDGVLVGRATWGNPWFFDGIHATTEQNLHAAMQHGEYLETHFPEVHFAHLRKHLIWYCRDFPGAKELRGKLMQAKNSEAVKKTITEFLETCTRIAEKT
jgi:tRNA-dihydrouridine synthase